MHRGRSLIVLAFCAASQVVAFSTCQRARRACRSGGLVLTQSARRSEQELQTYEINIQLNKLASKCARSRSPKLAEEALQILRDMENPDTVAYNSVLKALAKVAPASLPRSRRSVTAVAEDLLNEMQECYEEQVRLNEEWYASLSSNRLSDAEINQGAPQVLVKPDVRSVSTVMDGLARCGTVEAARRAERLLSDLHEKCSSTGDVLLQPNLISYNTLLSAYAKCGESATCLRILGDMPMEPDVISYNACLHAIARSRSPDAGEKAEELLRSMSVVPNTRSFATCIDAWAQNGEPDRAYAILAEMPEPNAVAYTAVIHAYARSHVVDKASRSLEILKEMKDANVQPNQMTYNNILNAMASSDPQPDLVCRIRDVYSDMVSQGLVDHCSFGTVLKACSNLLVKDADFASDVFHEAVKRGQVSIGVLWQLRQAVPVDVFRELVGEGEWDDLPDEWRTNVNERGRRANVNERRRRRRR